MAEWDAASVDDELLKSLDGPLGGIFERFGRMHNKLHIAPGIGERIVRIRTSGPSRGSGHMLTYITRLIVATGDDRLINELAPMVNHPDDSIAVEVVGDLGMGRNSEFMPELLLKALNSDRHKLVAEALKWVPGYSGNSRNTELRQALTRIFESDDEELKFHASFALLHEYQDQRAMNYLAEQAMGKDTERVRRALTWLGDNALEGHPVFPKLLEAVDRHLASDQTMLRKAAVRALNPYTGTEVLARLVPLLVSEDQALVEQAAYILRQYRDKQSLKAALQKAVKSEDSELAKRAKEILDSLR
jgi:HEAT repeat protein